MCDSLYPMAQSRSRTKARTKVLIIYTGGTFGMEEDPKSGSGYRIPHLSPNELKERLYRRTPELSLLAECDIHVFSNMDSAHIGPEQWIGLASYIRKHWKQYRGIVVLHGTDTLSYTAAALSYLLLPCEVPVILTGAMRPLSALRTDARRNLIAAVEIAANGPRPALDQVFVFFNDRLMLGNRTRKKGARQFDAFESPRFPILARVGGEIEYRDNLLERVHPSRARAQRMAKLLVPAFSRKVLHLVLTPGFPVSALESATCMKELEGVVLTVFASGTAPTHLPGMRQWLRGLAQRKVPVVLVTEREGSPADPMSYQSGRQLEEWGCLSAGAMTPEAAYVKACFLLGQARGKDRFAELWGQNLAFEIGQV